MKSLSLVELVAVLFTGIAGLASAMQAYVSWETRGEVSRAIVFAQRIDACAKVIAAIEPFVARARKESRRALKSGPTQERYSLPRFYYRQSSGNPEFNAKHNPRVERWRQASAALSIVSPEGTIGQVEFFDEAITQQIPEGKFMTQSELVSWLERLEANSQKLTTVCRRLL